LLKKSIVNPRIFGVVCTRYKTGRTVVTIKNKIMAVVIFNPGIGVSKEDDMEDDDPNKDLVIIGIVVAVAVVADYRKYV